MAWSEARAPSGAGALVWGRRRPGPGPERRRAFLGFRAACGRHGHATLVRASEATRRAVPVFHPDPAPVAALSAGLRAKFDPRGILNPGRMAAPAPAPAEGAA